MVALAKYYNNAFLAWAVNSAGRGIIYLVKQRYKYNNVYYRENWDHGGQTIQKLVGWFTSGATKHQLVLVGKEMHREDQTVIRDAATASELKTFSIVGEASSPQFKAISGHDDRIIAWLIGLVVGQSRYKIWERQKNKKKEKQRQKELEKNPLYKRLKGKNQSNNPILGSEC